MDKFTGVIIEESLEDKNVLKEIKILDTEVEEVGESHQTPWLKQWHLYNVEIEQEKAEEVAEKLSRALESEHHWYADYKNDETHYIIFKNKVFKIDRKSYDQYKEAYDYGISVGIPDYQVDFTKNIVK